MLSDSEGSDVESLHKLTINEHYAKAFEYKKEREELQKLKEKYGSDFEDDEDKSETDSESDESEDEDGEELTPMVDAAILRTLARIKRKDPSIYDTNKSIFGEEHQKIRPVSRSVKVPKDKSKPITIRQVALESALNQESRSPSPEPLPHVEEQRALRDETIAAFHNAVPDDDDDDEDNLLVPREKTQDEREQEEEEYHAFLKREVGGDLRELVTADINAEETMVTGQDEILEGEDGKGEKKTKKKVKKAKDGEASKDTLPGKSRQESDQEFLMNYILNRGWIDRSANHIPTYGEITSPKSKGKKAAKHEEYDSGQDAGGAELLPTADPDLDEEDFEEIVDRFESSYNFRYEEPDAAVIPSHPRNLSSLVRREDTKRKDARERKRQRKEEELQKRREEVKRLKGLKMKEIRARLEKIGREGGKNLDESKALQELDLEGEWDPAAHDRQMNELYNEEDLGNDEKPQWEDDIDIGGIPFDSDGPTKKSKKKKKKKKGEENDEADIGVDVDIMDADVERIVDDEEWDGTEEMRKRKLDEYMDEIYGLDFNDLVGDMPTRFKYVPVQPQNFALTPAEILMATDQELNEYMGVKKYAPYRKEVKWDSKRNDRLKELKSKLSERTVHDGFVAGSSRDSATGEKPTKKRKGKKERMKLKVADGGDDGDNEDAISASKRKRDIEEADEPEGAAQEDVVKKKRRRKHRDRESAEWSLAMMQNRPLPGAITDKTNGAHENLCQNISSPILLHDFPLPRTSQNSRRTLIMFTPSQSPNFSSVLPKSPSPQVQTLLAYCDALNEWDLDQVAAVFDDSLEHHILPKSLGRPVLNKKQYLTYFAGVMPLFKSFHLTLHEVIEAGNVITVHGSSAGDSATGAPYKNEYMLIIHFAAPKEGGDGLPKISRVKEFVDSSAVTKFFTEERAKAAKAAAAAGSA
ncbi:hypothetical protein D9615_002328 [Tricholomella constricta]|uniref:Kri1-like C-terminal domain-containing protein n=1 Tax=Tricholomella constricta TaxID=117010 RepID=A0A8H5HMQ0_9AGAR|nr:hypothetical protein D9615_002328 [Tricholomella constricta]